MVQPHGGTLVERFIEEDEFARIKVDRELTLSERVLFDAFMIAIGGFSPLKGFVAEEDYREILAHMRMKSGLLFAIPIVLPVRADLFEPLRVGHKVLLKNPSGNAVGFLEVSGKFRRDPKLEAAKVFSTTDPRHPGVKNLYDEGEYVVSGEMKLVRSRIDSGFPGHFRTPRGTRRYFQEHNWKRVVAFQTRNPMHRAHEYLTKVALEMVDGLMIHPIVGEVKADDVPADVRMECYKVLIENYYDPHRVLLNILPMAMRYAGPREALHHAIIRQNYGCTHIIIGRDHAGVENYYGPYDAQRIFSEISTDDLRITPIFFEDAFYCRRCTQMATAKTCSHDSRHRVAFSGTRVREMLRNGEQLPEEFTRPEVAEILKQWAMQTR